MTSSTLSLIRSRNDSSISMTISATSKQTQEHLQEIRNPRKNGIRFRKRKQEEKEAEKAALDDLKQLEEPPHASIKQIR